MNRTMTLEKPALSYGIAVFLLILAISVIENKLGRSQICFLQIFTRGAITIYILIHLKCDFM